MQLYPGGVSRQVSDSERMSYLGVFYLMISLLVCVALIAVEKKVQKC